MSTIDPKLLDAVMRAIAKAGDYQPEMAEYWSDEIKKEARAAIRTVRKYDKRKAAP